MATRIGVDVGGTFTDLVWYDESTGSVVVSKEPTSPAAPEEGVLAAIDAAIPPAGLAVARYFLHGTTVGLNALLQRAGAVVGLLATDGFRDVLEVRRGDRDDPYDLFWAPPPPLVPRALRLPVRERMLADGAVWIPIARSDVEDAARRFTEEGVNAVAIAFLHAYANPAHELEAERILRAAGFEGAISLSHRVSGEYREYERTTTTVVDAFVRRRMGPYLERLASTLATRGFVGDPLITRSGGGSMTFAQAAARPFETVLSGPVAGADATAAIARTLGLEMAIGADVGGTSFDTCVIVDGEVPVLYQGSVVGLPIQTPWVDVRSIGAGGGSIAFVDGGGLLRVGPRSAGAIPGPACYGKGGVEPTVTDAAVALGMLPPVAIAGGVTLDLERARAALAPLAAPLGLEGADAVARGVLQIAAASMAGAIRGITIEQGLDPRGATLVAFGGAGPLFATLLADELDVTRIVVPPHAGNFSAWGLLGADLRQATSRTRIVRLDEAGVATVGALASELHHELDGRATATSSARRREVHADLRYLGQEHTLTVPVPNDDGVVSVTADALHALFEECYERTFAIRIDEAVEVVTVRAVVVEPLPTRAAQAPASPDPVAGGASRSVTAWSFTERRELAFAAVERASIPPGSTLAGPAIIAEPTTTTYLDAGYRATCDETGSLLIERVGS